MDGLTAGALARVGLLPLQVGVGILLACSGLWVLLARPRRLANAALGTLLILFAGSSIGFQLMRDATAAGAFQAFRLTATLYEVPAAFLILLVLDDLFLPKPRTRPRTALLAAAGALTAALFLMVAASPPTGYYDSVPGVGASITYAWTDTGVGRLYAVALFLVEGAAVLVTARFAASPKHGALARRQAAVFGLAFGFLAGQVGGQATATLLAQVVGLGPADPLASVLVWPRVTTTVVGILDAALLLASLRWLPLAFEGRARRWAAAGLLLPLAAGAFDAFLGALYVATGFVLVQGYSNSRFVWNSAFAVTLAVAVVRYDLAGLGGPARERLANLGAASLALCVAIIAAGILVSTTGPRAPALLLAALMVASPVALAHPRAAAASRRLVARLQLDPRDPQVLEARVRIYAESLQAALAPEGRVAPGAEPVLRALRAQLGLTERDHAMLLSALAQREDRGGLVAYRLALEALGPERAEDGDQPELRRLRGALGVTDKQHELLAAELRGGAAPPEPGALLLGRYRVVRPLGRGSYGEVLLARDSRLGRDVVLKRLLGEQRRSAQALRRFQKEMRMASALQHPNIVTVHDVEAVGEEAYIVMEYCPGGSLADVLRARGRLPEAEVVRLGLDVLAALEALHARGIVHRDVKPGNILLDAHGRAKLGDFTLAHEVVSGDTAGGDGPHGPAGTFAYMAPEQAKGLQAQPASDVYGLAASLYEALAGRPPLEVEGLTPLAAARRVVEEAPRLPVPGGSKEFSDVLARGLAKAPEDRWPGAAAMARALRRPSSPPHLPRA